ncbi:meiosis-specific transcription factor ndt80, partial [Verticillium nonalfalfae]
QLATGYKRTTPAGLTQTDYEPSPAPPGLEYLDIQHQGHSIPIGNPLGSSLGPRTTALPHLGTQISTRDQYSTATPTFKRPTEHLSRSPSFTASVNRRHPLSPTPSPITNFTNAVRMDQYSSKTPASVPPLSSITTLGNLSYADASSATGTLPVKIEIQGNIDKGFFQSDCEWTCYRRNYFSCICSYSLSPYYSSQSLQFQQLGSKQPLNVFGFAMSISAVVADNDSHTIELVQHTPKRDKGPIAKPDKVRLLPKPLQPVHHPLGLYAHDSGMGGPSRMAYPDAFSGGHHAGDAYQNEHTFERIQFKQATANNGKRRAAQQYYHLVIELWADVGAQAAEKFVRVAYRKSAKMIVRGRSPGHYQGERRGSTSSGPGGSGGSMGGFSSGTMIPPEFPPSGPSMGPAYGHHFEPRGGMSGFGPARHHHEMAYEPMIPHDDIKPLDTTKGYQYYPGPMYEGPHGDKGGIDVFHPHRNGHDGALPHMAASLEPPHDRFKRDPEADLLSGRFMPGPLAVSNRCNTYEGKNTSTGYYPTAVPPNNINIANIT